MVGCETRASNLSQYTPSASGTRVLQFCVDLGAPQLERGSVRRVADDLVVKGCEVAAAWASNGAIATYRNDEQRRG